MNDEARCQKKRNAFKLRPTNTTQCYDIKEKRRNNTRLNETKKHLYNMSKCGF